MVGRDVGSGYDRGLGVVRHFVKTVQELGRYVARVGLNASKGSVGGKRQWAGRKVERLNWVRFSGSQERRYSTAAVRSRRRWNYMYRIIRDTYFYKSITKHTSPTNKMRMRMKMKKKKKKEKKQKEKSKKEKKRNSIEGKGKKNSSIVVTNWENVSIT